MDDYLVSVVNDGKVVDLYFSNLEDIDTIRALHRGCDIETMRVGGTAQPKSNGDSRKKLHRQLHAVRCIETGVVYPSVKECSRETGIGVKSIYESIRRGIAAKGMNFEYLKD